MNVEDAAHLIAHEYAGGVPALSVRMGIGKVVFGGKVNPNDKGHLLGLVESVRMQQLTGRADILYAMADALDHVCLRKPSFASGDIAKAVTSTCAEFGDFLRQIDSSMNDGKVTRNELKKIEKELLEMIAAANGLCAMVAGKVPEASR